MRIAITTRITDAEGYDEPRDALAQDWAGFMAQAFPEAAWMPFPNLGTNAISQANAWGIDAIILSGGNDLGERPLRDETEKALLTWAIDNGKPVFGVCRGLQLIQHYFGGPLEPCDGHAGTRHSVRIGGSGMDVNSYHNWCIPEAAEGLEPLAVAQDGSVEAVIHEAHPLVGVMWHPERESSCQEADVTLMREVLLGGSR